MKNSKLFSLKLSDFWKGLIVAIVTAVLTILYQSISNSTFPVTWAEWKVILLAGLGAGIAYLLKNLLSNSAGQILTKEPPKFTELTKDDVTVKDEAVK